MIHQRQLAAIMFTAIVGYSAMMQHNEEQAVQIIRRYLKVLHEEVVGHHGKVLNDYGDGSLCIFSSAVDAVAMPPWDTNVTAGILTKLFPLVGVIIPGWSKIFSFTRYDKRKNSKTYGTLMKKK